MLDVVFDTEATASCGCATLDAGDMVTCGEEPIGTLVMACVHEHVERLPVCAGCAAEVQRGAGEWTCSQCDDDSPQAHLCTPYVVIEWGGGERTVVQEGGGNA